MGTILYCCKMPKENKDVAYINSSSIQTNIFKFETRSSINEENKRHLFAQESIRTISKNSDILLPTCQSKICLQHFEKMKVLGRGSFGKVLLVKKISNGKMLAMKVLKKSLIRIKNQEDHTKTERKILEKLDHPFLVKLQYAFQDKKRLYLITEFMQGGELFYHLSTEGIFNEERAKFYICEIILAIEYLHKNKFIYRDLKPENILLGIDGHIKLTDFGLSKMILSKKDEKAFTVCGTPKYLAPEIIRGRGYDKSVDWWSLGVLFYEMLCGYSPFKMNFLDKKKLDFTMYTIPIKMFDFFSEEAKSLIRALLTVEPFKRLGYGPRGSENVKSHPFFKDVDWNDFNAKLVDPPFKPRINVALNGEYIDLNNFDTVFTRENIFEESKDKQDSQYNVDENYKINSHYLLNENCSNSISDFHGFTFVKNNHSLLDGN